MEEKTFKVVNDEGQEVECEALFTFESEATGKMYVVYTDGELEDGAEKVYANVVEIINDEGDARLLPIETDEEYDLISSMLEKLQTEEGINDLLNEDNLSTEMKDYFMDGMK